MHARVIGAAATAALSLAVAGLPGATSQKICAAAGPYWPTMTLALSGGSAWVACKEQSRVIRVDAAGRRTASVRLGTPAIAVRAAFGSIWALDSGGTLYRIGPHTARVQRRISLSVSAAYNIWAGAGSVWVADDQGARVVRVSPRTNRVVRRVPVGDGPASMAFGGGSAWVIDHRDLTIYRIDPGTSHATLFLTLSGDAPERLAWSSGSLWVTGRGTGLLRVDPANGAVETIDIAGTGIDLLAAGGALWIPTRSAEVDAQGLPTMALLQRVSPATGEVETVTQASGRVDVNGIAAGRGALWLADNHGGRLYRFPLP